MSAERTEKRSKLLIVLFLLMGITLIGSGVFVHNKMRTTESKEARDYLREATVQYKNTIVQQVQTDLGSLKRYATFVSENFDQNKEAILEDLRQENGHNKFIRMGFIDKEGFGYFVCDEGEDINGQYLGDQKVVKSALSGIPSISTTGWDERSGRHINMLCVPVYRENEIVGLLSGVLDSSEFSTLLQMPIAGGHGKLRITDENGQVVAHSQNLTDEGAARGILPSDYVLGKSDNQIIKELETTGESFFQGVSKDATEWVMILPMEFSDWYLVSVVPKETIGDNFMELSGMFLIALIMVFCLFLILFFFLQKTLRGNRERIIRLAYYDKLTGIYKKSKCWEKSLEYLKSDTPYALVLFDISNFKYINELFGYGKGDEMLCYMADVCKKHAKAQEIYYRDTADVFGMLLKYDTREAFTQRVQSILADIGSCSLGEEHKFKIICNCGIKVITSYKKGTDMDVFYDRAALALKEAKGHHDNTIVYYDDELHEKTKQRSEIEATMYQALEQREFFLNMQPKINLSTRKIEGAEVLVRWRKADGTMIYPDAFIPLFEQNGFIVKLDLYVMEEACRYLKMWRDAGYPMMPLSVNQSRILFYRADYIEQLCKLLKKYEVDPSYLILEVTEGVMVEHSGRMKRVIEELHKIGFEVSMDDFGSGYSSLNILKELEIDELKLDRAFLSETTSGERRNMIMKNVIQLAKDLHITTVVEGVETSEQAELIATLGANIGQGYYYDRPMEVEQFVEVAFEK